MLKHLVICDLAEQSQYLHPIVDWHHGEWMAAHAGQRITNEDEKLSQRVKILESHLGSDAIPTTFVALLHGEPIGSISVVYYQFTEHHTQSEWLTNVYVTEAQRGKGVGAYLLEYACVHARKAGVKQLKLYTRDREAYYLKRGWRALNKGRVQGCEVNILQCILSP